MGLNRTMGHFYKNMSTYMRCCNRKKRNKQHSASSAKLKLYLAHCNVIIIDRSRIWYFCEWCWLVITNDEFDAKILTKCQQITLKNKHCRAGAIIIRAFVCARVNRLRFKCNYCVVSKEKRPSKQLMNERLRTRLRMNTERNRKRELKIIYREVRSTP